MPTATATLGWTLANLGPAPTTYTFPSSCTESKYNIAYSEYPDGGAWDNKCDSNTWTRTECFARPTDSALAEEYITNPFMQGYYSPGPSCPKAWKTVGVLAHQTQAPDAGSESDSDSDSLISSSGIFTIDPNAESSEIFTDGPYIFRAPDAWAALLDEGETLVACCPSTMTVGADGGCYSLLPDISISTGCAFAYPPLSFNEPITSTTFPLNGTTTTGSLNVPVTSLPEPTVETTTFEESERESLVAVSVRGPVYFVHMPSDLSEDEANPGETGSSGDGEGGEETGTNAAVPLQIAGGKGPWRHIGGIAGVLGVSILAGVGLVLPW
ncbi:hypothetical protein BDV19DRAFT_362114 [Aspergillus venezuelensis]